jgi:hypothetical protein
VTAASGPKASIPKPKKVKLEYQLCSFDKMPKKTMRVQVPDTRKAVLEGLGFSRTKLDIPKEQVHKEIKERALVEGFNVRDLDHKKRTVDLNYLPKGLDEEPPLAPEFEAIKEKLRREREARGEKEKPEEMVRGPLPEPQPIGKCPNCGCDLQSRWKGGHINCKNCHACMIFMTQKNRPTTFLGGPG